METEADPMVVDVGHNISNVRHRSNVVDADDVGYMHCMQIEKT